MNGSQNRKSTRLFAPSIKRGAALFLAVGLVVAFSCGSAFAQSQKAEPEEGTENIDPHDFKRKEFCSHCHEPEPPMLRLDEVTTCTRCHANIVGDHPVTRHPIRKMPKISIPAKLPLTESGEMVCSTCHEPHNKTKFSKMLRVDYFTLCSACHKGY